jgi:hypothetical protein
MALASFTPGQTLDPSCLPSDPTCIVVNTTVVAANFVATSTTATSTFAGAVGFGTTSPSSLLTVSGDGYFTGNIGIGLVPVNPGLEMKGTGGLALRLTDTISNSSTILQTLGDGTARLVLNDSTWGGHRWDIGVGPQFSTASTTLAFRDVSSGGVRMVIDGSGNVGIGNSSPTYKLDVNGNGHFTGLLDAANFVATSSTATSTFAGGFTIGTNKFMVDRSTGFVGIGTAAPNTMLHIQNDQNAGTKFKIGNATVGTAAFSQGTVSSDVATVSFYAMSSGYTTSGRYIASGALIDGVGIGGFGLSAVNGDMMFYTSAGAERMRINSSGNVGIGTTSPAYKLDVTGTGHFTSLVDATNFVATSSTATSTFAGGFSIGTSQFVVQHTTGNVGIGTATPGSTLSLAAVSGPTLNLDSGVGRSTKFISGNTDGTLTVQGTTDNNSATKATFVFNSVSTVDGTSALGTRPILDIQNGGVSKFFITPAGNVGIGTTTPAVALQVASAGGVQMRVGDTTGGFYFDIGRNSSSGAFTIQGNNASAQNIVLAPTSGNVGIGTSSPTAQLSTTGTVRFSNFGAGTLQTDANGNLSVSSDERLKNVQGTFARGLAEIELLNPILYKWKPETDYDVSTTYAGFSAQNVQSAIPEAVGQDGHGYLTLQDRPLIAAAVNAIKSIAGISDDFRVHLTAWLGDASNGIPTIFAQVGNFDTTNTQTTNTQTLCVDGQCLTKSDVHALLQMVQQQNGIGASTGSPPPASQFSSDLDLGSTYDATSTP